MGDAPPPALPPELLHVPTRALEGYVRARLIQFAAAFARRVNPTLSQQIVEQAAAEAIASLPAPEFSQVSVESRDLQLVFRHDCLSLGCLDPQCVLCEHNPHRRCNVNFAPKYLVNDVLKAKCEAPIRVEVIDRATGVPLGEDIQDIHLEMCILDGNAYDAKCLEAGQERDDDLDACALLVNNKAQPLLSPAGAAAHNAASKVVVQLTRGMAQLPELHVSDSSEAMLSGRKPPFRLLVRAVASDGRKVNIRHAVSEGFVVATRRTRTAGKVEIPNVDDHVSKLEHMGKETVKKLNDLKLAAHQAGVEISVPRNTILKVGEFRKLALLAEADGHLRQKLQQVLKLSKEKWDDARDHAMRAVVADNRMRIWYADKATMELGLLFTCRLGNVDLDRPVGLLQKKSQDQAQTTMEATLMAQQTPQQREHVRQLQPNAVASWWQAGHPGWAIYPVDSETFMSTGALENVNVQHEHILAPSPPADQTAGPSHAGLRQGLRGQAQPLVTQPVASQGQGFVPQGQAGDQAASFVMQAGPRGASRPPMPHGSSSGAGPSTSGAPGQPSPFARAQANRLENSLNLSNLGSLLSGPVDLSKFQSFGAVHNFPSIPQAASSGGLEQLLNAIPSGELEQLLQQHGDHALGMLGSIGESPFRSGNMGRLQSVGVAKLESLELPDAVAAVAMLHDMPPEARAQAGLMARTNSGLQSMQSIEQALPNVEQDILDRVASDWISQQQCGGVSAAEALQNAKPAAAGPSMPDVAEPGPAGLPPASLPVSAAAEQLPPPVPLPIPVSSAS